MISRLMFQLSGYVNMIVSACFTELFLSERKRNKSTHQGRNILVEMRLEDLRSYSAPSIGAKNADVLMK